MAERRLAGRRIAGATARHGSGLARAGGRLRPWLALGGLLLALAGLGARGADSLAPQAAAAPAARPAASAPSARAAAIAASAAARAASVGLPGLAAPSPVPRVEPVRPNANHLVSPGLAFQPPAQPPRWHTLAEDGLHDPRGPGLSSLQQPGEALAALPPDVTGNQVRWVQALEQGVITPRANLLAGTEIRLRDQDLIVAKNGSMPAVKFPHRQHTLWLDCSNCHPFPFKEKLGGNKLSMMAILNGEQCGLCHGAVSFPLTECNRCHNTPNDEVRRLGALQGAPASPEGSASAASASAAGGARP